MNTGNFLGISQDYGLRDAFLRFQRWDSNPEESQVPEGRKNRASIMCFCRP